jgi:hypothetical protein
MEPTIKEKPVKDSVTEEQMIAIRKETINNIKEELGDLRIQAEYEELITTIEVSRYKRFEISMKMAQYSQYDTEPDPSTQQK